MEKSMPLEKNLQNFSDACAANDILSSLLGGYITVTRSLLDLAIARWQFTTNLPNKNLRFRYLLNTFVANHFGWPICLKNSGVLIGPTC